MYIILGMNKQNMIYPYSEIFIPKLSERLIYATTCMNHENLLRKWRPTCKVTYCMFPFKCNVQNRNVRRHRKLPSDFQEPELGVNGEWLLMGMEFLFVMLKIFLELDHNDSNNHRNKGYIKNDWVVTFKMVNLLCYSLIKKRIWLSAWFHIYLIMFFCIFKFL